MRPRTAAIIQARTSSSRLPNKVLLELGGEPMLVRVVERARRAQTLDAVIVATTTDPADEPIVQLCAARGYRSFRGSLPDVLDRYYQAARSAGAEAVVRITADCPVIDPGVIDDTVNAFRSGLSGSPFDFAANRLPPPWKRTYPIGLDVEVCTFAALEQAWKEADQLYQREHVMPYLYEDSPVVDSLTGQISPPPIPEGRPSHPFRVLLLNHDPDYGSLRWTVDTPQDLELLRLIYAHFGGRDDFSWLEVLQLIQHDPALAEINASVRHKSVSEIDERPRRSPRRPSGETPGGGL